MRTGAVSPRSAREPDTCVVAGATGEAWRRHAAETTQAASETPSTTCRRVTKAPKRGLRSTAFRRATRGRRAPLSANLPVSVCDVTDEVLRVAVTPRRICPASRAGVHYPACRTTSSTIVHRARVAAGTTSWFRPSAGRPPTRASWIRSSRDPRFSADIR